MFSRAMNHTSLSGNLMYMSRFSGFQENGVRLIALCQVIVPISYSGQDNANNV